MFNRVKWVHLWMAALIWLIPLSAVAADDVTLNFRDTDIRQVIEFVSEFSGKNFLVDEKVKGKVTVVSATPVSPEAAYQAFLSVLEVNGFAAVPNGAVIKIIPAAEAKQKGVRLGSKKLPPSSDDLLTQIINLRYADAQQLSAVLRPLVSADGNLAAFAPTNTLILTDTSINVRRMMELVKSLDVNEVLGIKLFALQYASAEKLAKTLSALYGGKGDEGRKVQVIAHNPGNFLIVAASGALISEISQVVAKLDVEPRADSGQVEVRYLKNADASEVAKVLESLIGADGKEGEGSSRQRLFSSEVKVVADDATNALLVTASPADRTAVSQIVDKLDIRRLQVLVEALIVEVRADTAQQFGVEWRALGDFNAPGRRAFGGTAFSNQAGANIGTVAANPLSTNSGMVVGMVDGTLSFGGTQIANLGALARALEAVSDTNVLSTPNILTMDNEEAEIIVGQNVPFVTGSFAQASGSGGNVNPFQTIERKDIGLTLRVKPQISEGDTVRLELYQEVSSLNPSVTGASDLITNKRSVKTVVLANNRQIVVLGGLMREDYSTSVQRVPCIGAVPVLGEPFKYTQNDRRKTNLMVFLRPHIIKTDHDLKTVTQEKYLDIRELHDDAPDHGTLLFPREREALPEHMNPMRETEPEAGGVGTEAK